MNFYHSLAADCNMVLSSTQTLDRGLVSSRPSRLYINRQNRPMISDSYLDNMRIYSSKTTSDGILSLENLQDMCTFDLEKDYKHLRRRTQGSNKVDYCHVTAEGVVQLKSISPNAIPAHEEHTLDHFPDEVTGLCMDCLCNTDGTYFRDLLLGAEEAVNTCIATESVNCPPGVSVAEGTRFGVDNGNGKTAGVTIGYVNPFATGCISDTGVYIDLAENEGNAQFCLDLLTAAVPAFQEP